jgi:hypothetical protein
VGTARPWLVVPRVRHAQDGRTVAICEHNGTQSFFFYRTDHKDYERVSVRPPAAACVSSSRCRHENQTVLSVDPPRGWQVSDCVDSKKEYQCDWAGWRGQAQRSPTAAAASVRGARA